jgi:hypothetical protein
MERKRVTNIVADEYCVAVDAADTSTAARIDKETTTLAHGVTADIGIGDKSGLPAPCPDWNAEGLIDLSRPRQLPL